MNRDEMYVEGARIASDLMDQYDFVLYRRLLQDCDLIRELKSPRRGRVVCKDELTLVAIQDIVGRFADLQERCEEEL